MSVIVISLDKKDITITDKDKTLFDFYKLFDKKENRNRINNIDNILDNIAEKIIKEVTTIKGVSKFLQENKEFVEKHIEKFVNRITELCNNKELDKEQCLEIFNARKSIQFTKKESKAKLIQLINTTINRNYYKNEEMKNIIDIERLNTKYKWVVIFAIAICVVLATLNLYLLVNSKTPTKTNTAIIEQLQEENNSLKQKWQDYENQYRHNGTVNNNEEIVPNEDSITN